MQACTAGNSVSQWGEGPVWTGQKLLFVDIEGHKIREYDPVSAVDREWSVGERVGLVVPRSSGNGLVMGGDNGISSFDPETGEKNQWVDPEPDKKPDNRFNDGKCDPTGRLWAGTISTVKKEGDASLYCLDTDKNLTLKYPGVTNSNGLCWSSDAEVFYYIDTPTKKIRVFDFNNDTSEISNEQIAVDTVDWEGSPDGMCIDNNDNLWVAFCRGSVVRCIDPKTATVLEQIDLPVSGVTSCAFGGESMDTLFITTGQFSNLEESGAGRLYAAKPGVSGPPSVPFAG